MAANFVLIREVTLNTSASSVTLSSIPQTGYTDLKLALTLRTDTGDSSIRVYFNNDTTATNYPRIRLIGEGTSGTSSSSASDGITIFGNSSTTTSNVFCNAEVYIPNYTSSNVKSFSTDSVMENNANYAIDGLFAAKWTGTSAITSISIVTGGSNLVAGSTVSLYGIAAVGTTPTVVPKASGGDIVVNDGTYWYHAFLSSGTFTPNTNISADCLVVAGGGGGGNSGGGGAGGFRTLSNQLLLAQNYTCTVGAGGAGNNSNNQGNNGNTSSLGSILISSGGGGGGKGINVSGDPLRNGLSGGSGGGGGGADPAYGNSSGGSGNAGSYSPVEGYAGGAGTAQTYGRGGGGGGGAGQAGTAGQFNSPGGVGGNGLSTAISGGSTTGLGQLSGGSYYFAGGGAGYNDGFTVSGGIGGGGSGYSAGTVNTGGGGACYGAGGSGVIVIRYAMA